MWEPLTKAEAKRLYHCARPEASAQSTDVVLEGYKMVEEALQFPARIKAFYATEPLPDVPGLPGVKRYIVSGSDVKAFSSMEKFPGVACRVTLEYAARVEPTENALFLHAIRDPGNAGSIVRSADWFGIPKVVTSQSVSLWNPKLLAASMGSVLRTGVVKDQEISSLASTHHIYISDLDGIAVEDVVLRTPWVLCIGNESRGVQGLEVERAIRVTIPRVGKHVDSLNAAISCAILLDRFRTAPSAQ